MNSSHTVEVYTYSYREPLALQLPDSCTLKRAKAEISAKLGLQPNTIELFGLCLGTLEQPTRILLESDVITTGAKLSLQRWNFDVERERKMVRKDDVAINLLYNEAAYHLDRGRIQPSDSQLEELEAFSDPSFPTERQYLELISTIPGYTAYVAEGCVVMEEVATNDVRIASGTTVQCLLDAHCLAFKDDVRKSENLIDWPWTSVRRWKMPSSNQINFEVCLMKGNAPVMCWVYLASPLAQLIFHRACGICNEVKRLQDKAEVALQPANPHLAGKHYDPLAELVDNLLFKGPKFSSIK